MRCCIWSSKTGLFAPIDMTQFESASLEELYAVLLRDDPVMRTLTELRLNGDSERLKILLADSILTTHWLQWRFDHQLHINDEDWAQALLR